MAAQSEAAAPVRCAIYTRKSSDERLDAEYSSLDNQRAYCSAYIASQGGKGWAGMPTGYDDGGYSGGSLRRPALSRLREDIAAGAIDVVVVYKIDRLSRSLRDFVNLISEFEASNVAFVSVTQSFDTHSSMGRLTLNVLLSFAQFEREVTGERLKDWFAGARSKGLWVPERPYGYAKEGGNHLVPHPEEAEVVRRIFRRYCRLGSCRLVADELFADGIFNKRGRPWSASMVLHTLKHRVYRGEIVHRGQGQVGAHEPIVSEHLWQRANATFRAGKWHRRTLVDPPVPALLKGLVYDRLGGKMHHTFMRAKGRLYRYYIAGGEARSYGRDSDPYMRFSAEALERSVVSVVDRMTGSKWVERSNGEKLEIVRRHVERIDIGDTDMAVTFRTGAVVTAVPDGRMGQRRRQSPRGAAITPPAPR
ncbi:recombinase family protein [Xanthobacter autotrophicus]|uniref:recombinase family protein n=1 Tax=Xanthobacter autotrophicus TaxID=280 RepID=UPI00372A8281